MRPDDQPGDRSAVRPEISAFFARYADSSGAADPETVNERFAEVFLNLDPNSVTPVRREALLAALPKRQQMFASIGADGMDLAGLTETPLDDRHTLVSTSWQVRFTPAAGPVEPLTLRSDFLLRRNGDRWQIVLYLNHQDIGAIIERRRQA